MSNPYFKFKQFIVRQERCAMKVGTDGVLLGAWANVSGAVRILDVGTGTGLVALMLSQRSDAAIAAVEVEDNAFEQAMENVERSPWKQRLTLFHSAFQNFVEEVDGKYDLVVSNPPYFNNSLKAPLLERSLARHNDGLRPMDLLAGVDRVLTDEGRFCVILPYVESQLFIVDAALYGLYCCQKLNILPSPRKKPNRVLMEFTRKRQKSLESELCIRDEQGDYSVEYKKLTCDFYLFF